MYNPCGNRTCTMNIKSHQQFSLNLLNAWFFRLSRFPTHESIIIKNYEIIIAICYLLSYSTLSIIQSILELFDTINYNNFINNETKSCTPHHFAFRMSISRILVFEAARTGT